MSFLGPSKNMRFQEGKGPSKDMRFLGPSKDMRFQEGKQTMGPSKHMRSRVHQCQVRLGWVR